LFLGGTANPKGVRQRTDKAEGRRAASAQAAFPSRRARAKSVPEKEDGNVLYFWGYLLGVYYDAGGGELAFPKLESRVASARMQTALGKMIQTGNTCEECAYHEAGRGVAGGVLGLAFKPDLKAILGYQWG